MQMDRLIIQPVLAGLDFLEDGEILFCLFGRHEIGKGPSKHFAGLIPVDAPSTQSYLKLWI